MTVIAITFLRSPYKVLTLFSIFEVGMSDIKTFKLSTVYVISADEGSPMSVIIASNIVPEGSVARTDVPVARNPDNVSTLMTFITFSLNVAVDTHPVVPNIPIL